MVPEYVCLHYFIDDVIKSDSDESPIPFIKLKIDVCRF